MTRGDYLINRKLVFGHRGAVFAHKVPVQSGNILAQHLIR